MKKINPIPLNTIDPACIGAGGKEALKNVLSPEILEYPKQITGMTLAAIRLDLEEFEFIADFYQSLATLCRLHLALRRGEKANGNE